MLIWAHALVTIWDSLDIIASNDGASLIEIIECECKYMQHHAAAIQ